MKDFNFIIGKNLNSIRKQKNLSLDKVALLTGVSKAMLAQIERGDSNPTVTTLWKIATGLNVSFSYFMEEESHEVIYIAHDNIKPVIESDKKMKVYPLFPYDNKRKFEIFNIELEPGCSHQSPPHNDGIEEYIIVNKGEMEMVIGDDTYKLKYGDAMKYMANKAHCYKNTSNTLASFQNIIYYLK